MLPTLFGLSKSDPWTHYFRRPEAFWMAYCGAKIDWKVNGEGAIKLCPYCLVLKELEDANNAKII
jgi:hypothetical protein